MFLFLKLIYALYINFCLFYIWNQLIITLLAYLLCKNLIKFKYFYAFCKRYVFTIKNLANIVSSGCKMLIKFYYIWANGLLNYLYLSRDVITINKIFIFYERKNALLSYLDELLMQAFQYLYFTLKTLYYIIKLIIRFWIWFKLFCNRFHLDSV